MQSGNSSDIRFEIGHVLFIDIVGYSKLLINEQSEQIPTLRRIVRGTDQFRVADAEGKLIRLPTGDGGALVFRNSLEAPVLCALEIGKELKNHPELQVRMGIHSGPVNEIADLNQQANIAGVLQYCAITAAWAGDKELALQQLEAGLRAPNASLMLSYGALKLFPVWEPLRGDPRFERIVESLAPKDN